MRAKKNNSTSSGNQTNKKCYLEVFVGPVLDIILIYFESHLKNIIPNCLT